MSYWYRAPYCDLVMSNWEWSTRKKPNNNAPKSIKGDYGLSIHGNKIVLVDNTDDTTVEAKCHPDDNFDIGAGIKEAFKKLNEKHEEIRKQKEKEEKKIKVGDWVEIDDTGSSSRPWDTDFFCFEDNKQYAPYFRYGVIPVNGTIGKIVYVEGEDCLVQEKESPGYGEAEYTDMTCHNAIYIVSKDGLKKVVKPNV